MASMRRVSTAREIAAPPEVMWRLLVDTDQWPEWGPTVRDVDLHSDLLGPGATGFVTTLAGIDLPFEVTDYVEGTSWSWKVAGVDATSHSVEAVGGQRCRVTFGVPLPAAPYLAICRIALARLDRMGTGSG